MTTSVLTEISFLLLLSLRRRFLQNQEDCTFTLMTMLPALSTQIREEMDVEDIVHQLQQTAKPTTSPSSTTGVAMGDSIVSLAGSEATSTESSSENNGSSSSLGAPAPAATSSGEEADAEVEGAKTGQLNVGASKGSSRGVGESWSSEFQEMERDKMTTSQQVRTTSSWGLERMVEGDTDFINPSPCSA